MLVFASIAPSFLGDQFPWLTLVRPGTSDPRFESTLGFPVAAEGPPLP
jgi:hypothetical protein